MNRFNLPNVLHSIQDYAKKINSRLSILDVIGVSSTSLILTGTTLYILTITVSASDVSYREGERVPQEASGSIPDANLPFASSKGKTYTFTWCSGSSKISTKNKIYFKTEAEAIATGRTLSKLCHK